MDDRPSCVFSEEIKDSQGCVPISAMFSAEAKNCAVRDSVCFYFPYTASVDKPKPVKKRHTKEKARKGEPMDNEHIEQPAEHQPAEHQAAPSAPVAAHEVAVTATKEIAPLLDKATDFNGVLVALIAVAGGGAAWKFYSQFSKNKHEENMEKLRIQSEQQKNNDHAQCDAKHMALSAKVEELSAKLSAAEEKMAQPPAPPEMDLDLGDMNDRLEKLEKSLKQVKAKEPAKAPAKKK